MTKHQILPLSKSPDCSWTNLFINHFVQMHPASQLFFFSFSFVGTDPWGKMFATERSSVINSKRQPEGWDLLMRAAAWLNPLIAAWWTRTDLKTYFFFPSASFLACLQNKSFMLLVSVDSLKGKNLHLQQDCRILPPLLQIKGLKTTAGTHWTFSKKTLFPLYTVSGRKRTGTIWVTYSNFAKAYRMQ